MAAGCWGETGGRGHCIFHKVAGRHAEGAEKIERVERIVFDMLKMCVDHTFNASLRSKDISGLILLLPHLICIILLFWSKLFIFLYAKWCFSLSCRLNKLLDTSGLKLQRCLMMKYFPSLWSILVMLNLCQTEEFLDIESHFLFISQGLKQASH